MTFKELTSMRSSVRQYTDTPVKNEDLDYIMECARLAPSAVNYQPWHFYIATSEESKAALCRCYDREWFRSAQVYIVCTIRHDQAWVRKFDGKEHGDIDIAIATEHICLAAAERGLGTCWVCNFDSALCKQLLNFSDNEEPAVIVALGHPDPNTPAKEKQRKLLSEITSRI